MTDKRDSTGKFKKGVSGNLSGRPKTEKLTKKDKEELKKIIEDNVKDKNLMSEMLAFLVERASLVGDVHKYLKEYAPFLVPKLSSVKQEVEQETTIRVVIEGVEDIELLEKKEKMLDITPKDAKLEEGVDRKDDQDDKKS